MPLTEQQKDSKKQVKQLQKARKRLEKCLEAIKSYELTKSQFRKLSKSQDRLVALIDLLLSRIALPPEQYSESDYAPNGVNPGDSTYAAQSGDYNIMDKPDEEKYGRGSSHGGTGGSGGSLESSM